MLRAEISALRCTNWCTRLLALKKSAEGSDQLSYPRLPADQGYPRSARRCAALTARARGRAGQSSLPPRTPPLAWWTTRMARWPGRGRTPLRVVVQDKASFRTGLFSGRIMGLKLAGAAHCPLRWTIRRPTDHASPPATLLGFPLPSRPRSDTAGERSSSKPIAYLAVPPQAVRRSHLAGIGVGNA